MNNVKRLLSLVLCIICVLSMSTVAFAQENATVDEYPTIYTERGPIVYGGSLNARSTINTDIPAGSGVYYTVYTPQSFDVIVNFTSASGRFAVEIGGKSDGVLFSKIYTKRPSFERNCANLTNISSHTLIIFNDDLYSSSAYFQGSVDVVNCIH